MRSYSIGRAARLLGVSPDTVRRWADAGRLGTRRDASGRRLIDGRDLAAFAVELASGGSPSGSGAGGNGSGGGTGGAGGGTARDEDERPATSVRNSFPGIVTAIKLGDVAAQVEIQAGPHRLVSLLTREAVEELGLEVGMEATARVKSTNVHVDLG
jgi:molybdopterin-binding protein